MQKYDVFHVTRTYASSIEFKKQQFKRCADGEEYKRCADDEEKKLKFHHGTTKITGSKQLQFAVKFFDVEIHRIHPNPDFKALKSSQKLKFQHGLTRITGSKQLKHPVLFFDVEITRIHSNPNFEAFKESHGKEQNGICT